MISRHIICAVCKAPVAGVQVERFRHSREILLTVSCHGDRRRYELSENDMTDQPRSEWRMTVFEEEAKAEGRDEAPRR